MSGFVYLVIAVVFATVLAGLSAGRWFAATPEAGDLTGPGSLDAKCSTCSASKFETDQLESGWARLAGRPVCPECYGASWQEYSTVDGPRRCIWWDEATVTFSKWWAIDEQLRDVGWSTTVGGEQLDMTAEAVGPASLVLSSLSGSASFEAPARCWLVINDVDRTVTVRRPEWLPSHFGRPGPPPWSAA